MTHKQPEPNMRFIDAAHLKTHPRNMRRFYPPRDVAEMAASLKACQGNKIAMQVVPADEPGCYFVVDGNLRLAGGTWVRSARPSSARSSATQRPSSS
jgi:hypothetical protein